MLEGVSERFDVEDCFQILRAVSQEVCPTVVSMFFDVTHRHESHSDFCEKDLCVFCRYVEQRERRVRCDKISEYGLLNDGIPLFF